jgi:peroxiredoxin
VRGPDNERTQALLGKPLAHTKLTYGTGQTLDLAQFRGKKNVLLIVLRGFDGRVCEYCEAQTMALQGFVERFNALNTEVVVCYPGPQNALRAFIKQFGELPESNGPPTVTLTYDPGYKIIEALDISGQVALPTTLILDQQGVIRYAYVGLDSKDRPSADDLVYFVEHKLASPKP